MTAQPLSIGNLINVGVNLLAAPLPGQAFKTALILGSSSVIDVVQRYRTYTTLSQVAQDFGTTAPEYLAAVAWFSQKPTPNSLYIGRWVQTASAGQLVCGPLSTANTAIAAWNAISSGSFAVSINGTNYNISALNFSTASSLAAVAAIIQTALNTSLAGTTCIYQPAYNNFVITSPTTGATSTVTYLSTYGTGTDISAMMAGTLATGAYEANGIVAETALASVTLFDTNYGSLWFGLYVCGAAPTDYTAIGGYIEALGGKHIQAVPTQDVNTLLAGNTTNLAYLLQQLKYNFSFIQYSSTSLYAVVSLLAKALSVNYTQSNSAINLMYQQEPGIVAEYLTPTQAANVASYNCNVYVNYAIGGATPIIQFGNCPSGNFIDTVIGAAVFANTIQTNLFNIQYTAGTKIPQTDSGQGQLESGIVAACVQFVNNGWLAPGTWSGSSFGNLANGQFMPKGWYIYQPTIASQSTANRANRISVPFQVAAHLAGATNTVSVQVNIGS